MIELLFGTSPLLIFLGFIFSHASVLLTSMSVVSSSGLDA